MLTAVVGINWGDEGKGRMVDLLSSEYDIIIRYQGGNNAGHTVVNDLGKFILNLLPSGIIRSGKVNVMGPGMVIDVEHLVHEVRSLTERGLSITPERLKISDKAAICMPYHKMLDVLEEDRLADKKFGSTRRGIAPVYADKYMKKVIRTGDLLFPDTLRQKVYGLVEWKNITIRGYGRSDISADEIYEWLIKYGMPFVPFICDTTAYLNKSVEEGRSVLFEAQLGALRDIDFGIYPYTTSSSAIAAYAPIGAGVPARRTEKVIGIMKAYSSCVGEGPFVCEYFGPEGDALREAGSEYGAATGRPRRVGAFDAVASRYGVMVQGATELALTKLDTLSGMKRLAVCTAYDINGELTTDFPADERLNIAKPVYKYFEGFSGDISGCRTFGELPQAARDYVRFIEKEVGCRLSYISVGADREAYIKL
ncbi:MAG: adenylosuccinate synthase [Clostridiales bacterium]|nr:adenylosuccinate synthase [Clostridiales bacterium]